MGVFGKKAKEAEAEKKEQTLLRQEYIANVRKNLVSQLNNIDIQEQLS